MQLEQLQLLLDWSPAGLFITDMEGCCTYMNPHAKAICQSDPGASRRPWAQALGIENSNGVMESWSVQGGSGVLGNVSRLPPRFNFALD